MDKNSIAPATRIWWSRLTCYENENDWANYDLSRKSQEESNCHD